MIRNRRPSRTQVIQTIAVLNLAIASGFAAASGSAHSADIQGTAVVSVPSANFRADCSLSAEIVATLTEGDALEVLGSAGNWYRIRHAESGIEGCMHRSVIGAITTSSDEEAEGREEWQNEIREREEEARETELEAARERREAELEAERERRETELEAREEEAERRARDAEWAARRARGEKRVTGYFDLNPVGYGAPGEDSLHVEGSLFFFDEAGRPVAIPNSHFESDFDYGGDLAYGLAGGFLVALYRGGSIGGGASLTRATYAVDVDYEASEPHFRVPVIVGDTIAVEAPDRRETALHLHAVYAPPTPEQLRVRLFVGPSAFRIELPVTTGHSLIFLDSPPGYEILELGFSTSEETVIGGHLGTDVAYFFSKAFGIGATVIYSRATEEFRFSPAETTSDDQIVEEITLGGLSAMLGVRFRF